METEINIQGPLVEIYKNGVLHPATIVASTIGVIFFMTFLPQLFPIYSSAFTKSWV